MSDSISSITISANINENGGEGPSRTKPAAIREAELRGVIRVLINKNQRLQRPVVAARKLATYYQTAKDEVERMKQVAYNYKTGMERAERRSARLQQDLAIASRTGDQQKAREEATSKGTVMKEAPKGLPFYLPSSVTQLVDGFTASNVTLMKSLQKMSNNDGKVDKIVKENLELEEKNKRLQAELEIKSSLLEDYEAEMSKSEPKLDAETLARNIILQRKECAELKSKIHSYQVYVKHLREKNTAILDVVMTQLDKSNRGPMESVDGEDTVEDAGYASNVASAPVSNNASGYNSRDTRREDSLKSDSELHSTGIQTDSGFYSESGSEDGGNMESLKYEIENYKQQIKGMQGMVEGLTRQFQEKEKEVAKLMAMQSDMEQTWMQMQAEVEKHTKRSEEYQKRIKSLETEREESEMILNMMQERVDQVNSEKTDSTSLKDKIKELEQRVSEVPLMQSQLKIYEEEIKAYAVERKQLHAKQEQSDYELKRLRGYLRELQAGKQLTRQVSQPTTPERQVGRHQQPQQQQWQYDMGPRYAPPNRYQQDQPGRNTAIEPWKEALWAGHGGHHGATVVADGASSCRRDGSREEDIHERQRNRQLQPAGAQNRREFYQEGANDDEDDDFTAYANNGTVKCEKCQQRYPISLLQDHFRDCSRD